MMRRILLFIFVSIFGVCSVGHANSWEAHLHAGNTSVNGGLQFKRNFNTGFMKIGGAGIFTEDDDLEYKWAEFKFMVGRDNIQPGLTAEIGVKGIFGEVQDGRFSGDLGALAFATQVGYVFPTTVIPVPIEVFGGLSYAPSIIAFRDADGYLSYNFGAGVRIIQNAALLVEYTAYDIEMDSGPGSWDMDDSVIRLGLSLRF